MESVRTKGEAAEIEKTIRVAPARLLNVLFLTGEGQKSSLDGKASLINHPAPEDCGFFGRGR